MKTLLKDAFFAIMRKRLPADRAVILMYHSVGSGNGRFWNVTADAFAEQMGYLKESGSLVVPLEEVVRRVRASEKLGGVVAITFDDGYRDNYTVALPILKKYDLTATVFVTTANIGGTVDGMTYLTRSDITEMTAAGIVIAPHTQSHPRLAQMESDAARSEIAGSKLAVESLIGKRSGLFAYPYGNYDADTERIVRECGFDGAVGVQEGTVGPESDPYALPRNSIDASTTMVQFKGKLTCAVDRYETLKRLFI